MSMLRNGVMLTIMCLLLCLTFNYTFPLRESSKWNIFVNNNGQSESRHCDSKRHENSIKMSAIESTLKKVDSNIKKFKKKALCHFVNPDHNLTNFEEMVLKKKNPYVDMKELELKYYNGKNSRQIVEPGPNLVEEPALCDQENNMNVEIMNRGLSGFALPSKLLKTAGVLTKVNLGNLDNQLGNVIQSTILAKQPTVENPDVDLLSALKDDIKQFEDSKVVKS